MHSKKCIMLNGHNGIFYAVSDNDLYFKQICDDYEREFIDIVNSIVSDDDVCIDIGANIGIKTFIMSKKLQNGTVYSIECAPMVSDVLRKNVSANDLVNVQVECVAISDYIGESTFVDNSAWGHISVEGIVCDNPRLVHVCTLDDLSLKLNLNKIDFIKIDTEGQELNVLRGMENVLRRFNPWIFFEFNSFCLASYGNINPKEVLKFAFDNFKYVFRVHKNGNHLLDHYDKSDINTLLHDNIVYNGSVDDFLVTNKENALDIVHKLLHDGGFHTELEKTRNELEQTRNELEQTRNELDQTRNELGQMSSSLSWRVTKFLRISSFLIKQMFSKTKV